MKLPLRGVREPKLHLAHLLLEKGRPVPHPLILPLVELQRTFLLLCHFAKQIQVIGRGLNSLIKTLPLILLKLLEFGSKILQELTFLLRLDEEVSHCTCMLLSLILKLHVECLNCLAQ